MPGIGGTEGRWRNMGSKARKTAKYVELYEMFKKGIEEGLYAEGKYLPAEWTIGETHGVGRITVRNAMELLEADGLIRRIPGGGESCCQSAGKAGAPGRAHHCVCAFGRLWGKDPSAVYRRPVSPL